MEAYSYKKIKYIVKYPQNFQKDGVYPIIIFLHGDGTRGNDLDVLRTNSFFVETEKLDLKAIVYAPQCYADTWYDIFEQLTEFAEYVRNCPTSDKNRIYLIGASMGGYAVWQMAMSHPEWFAAIIPICGGGMYWNASRLKNVKVWAFHGSCDTIVFCEESKRMVESIRQNGGEAKLTIYEDVGHDSWTKVYRSQNVFDWLLEQILSPDSPERSEYNNAEQYG